MEFWSLMDKKEKMLKIKHPNAKNLIGEMFSRLDQIEVRGESVEQLYVVRTAFKQLIESIEEIPDETKEEEKKGG